MKKFKYKLEYSDNKVRLAAKTFFPFPYILCLGTPIIRIKTKYRDVTNYLLEHEETHVMQYKTKWFHALRYSLFRKYRFESELEAYYNGQIKHYGYKTLEDCAWIIKTLYENYDLKMSEDAIKQRLHECLIVGYYIK